MIERSRAGRRPAPKKRGSRTGFVVDPFRGRQYVFESGLEEEALHVLIADPDVTEIEEQLKPVFFRDAKSDEHSHWFDQRHRTSKGRRVATAVKYHDDAVRDGLFELLGHVARQAFVIDADGRLVPFAHEYRIVTERHLDGVRVDNARTIVACGAEQDVEATGIVRGWLQAADRTFPLGIVNGATGLGSRGFRAAVALIQSGAVVVPSGLRIAPETMVVNRLFNAGV
ncbi:hypothetical protein [Aureimonas jatrophae]|uniref:Uncharacterized protein n=1 Tax=Aureimonas jatrophae TaxID=1166073 RepID=A0A1H0M2D0_9HYPH|nr:hypothetical protein [Aureimonas jatrophae]MBB3952651.1 hypothetical protein [Aureimonas jatrophae]SDO74599.1 hypothetical protein SAMN05192530_11241 [Aureimonas jatrophae]